MEDYIKKRAEEIGNQYAYPVDFSGAGIPTCGLTKFELFAGMAMQGLVPHGYCNTVDCANDAVDHAKALCYALAKAEMEASNV